MKSKPRNPAKPAPAPHGFADVIDTLTGKSKRVPVDPRLGQSLDRWLGKKVNGQPRFVLPVALTPPAEAPPVEAPPAGEPAQSAEVDK